MLFDKQNATHRLVPLPTCATNSSTMMRSLMRYKRWADADLMQTVLALPPVTGRPEGGYITTIVRHFHTVDCIFRAHLLGIPHGYTSPNPPEPAALSELRECVDAWFGAMPNWAWNTLESAVGKAAVQRRLGQAGASLDGRDRTAHSAPAQVSPWVDPELFGEAMPQLSHRQARLLRELGDADLMIRSGAVEQRAHAHHRGMSRRVTLRAVGWRDDSE